MSAPAQVLNGYLTDEELAEELHVSLRTLRRWRVERRGPPFIKTGHQVLYSKSTVMRWLERLETKPQFR